MSHCFSTWGWVDRQDRNNPHLNQTSPILIRDQQTPNHSPKVRNRTDLAGRTGQMGSPGRPYLLNDHRQPRRTPESSPHTRRHLYHQLG